MSSVAAAREVARGFYPERRADDESGLDRVLAVALGHIKRLHGSRAAGGRSIVPLVGREGERLETLSEEELRWQVDALRLDLQRYGFLPEHVARAFALVRESSGRHLGMRHFDVQLVGGWALLNGMVAEMQTGEGKTLVATLPACTAALAGIPTHIITVNDYLARRDAEWMRPVYEGLGLTVGVVTQGVSLEERRDAYRCDITYGTNKEIVFDYLRDRLALRRRPGQIQLRLERLQDRESSIDQLRLRGLCYGIVDEADSVLIDEARTPLIISGPVDSSHEERLYEEALGLSEQLEQGRDYQIDFSRRSIELTEEGKETIEEIARPRGGFWSGRHRSEDMIKKALTARTLYHRDKQYVVKDGKVQIVDEYTGRLMPGRSWEGGLHQLVETKEGCEPTTPTEVLGRISYQRFFRRYLALAGMTGTAREAASELWSTYRLNVATVWTNRPMIRHEMPMRALPTHEEKWTAVAERVAELHDAGRPVLLGTRTVADSDEVARRLDAAGLPHRVLNAVQDQEEAEIIAGAGQDAKITVATNMAGRGTDIKLGPGIAERGGLHVIATELHEAGRIDRQLFGRCGRQGDPGSYEVFVSLEDDLMTKHGAARLAEIVTRWLPAGSGPGRWLTGRLFRRAQRSAEGKHFRIRKQLLKIDESLQNTLAFSGKGE